MSQQKTGGLEEAKTYMRDKEIPQLFESMMTALMFKKPENHLDFLEECLSKAKNEPKVKWHSFIEPLPPIPRKEKEVKLESKVDDEPKVSVKTYSPLPAIGSHEAPVKSIPEETNKLGDVATEPNISNPDVEIRVEGDSSENSPSDVISDAETGIVQNDGEDVNAGAETGPAEVDTEVNASLNAENVEGLAVSDEAGKTVDEGDVTPVTVDDGNDAVDAVNVNKESEPQAAVDEDDVTSVTVGEGNDAVDAVNVDKESEPQAIVDEGNVTPATVGDGNDAVDAVNVEKESEPQVTVDEGGVTPVTVGDGNEAVDAVNVDKESEPQATVDEGDGEEVVTTEDTGEGNKVDIAEEGDAGNKTESTIDSTQGDEAETAIDVVDGHNSGVALDGAEGNEAEMAEDGNKGSEIEVSPEVIAESAKEVCDETATIEVTDAEKASVEQTEVSGDVTIPVPFEKAVIFVIGGPGSGKGTQCSKIVDKYDFLHLSAGDLLRKEAAEKGGELAEIMKQGQLVPQEVTIGLLKQAMLDNVDSKGFLIDGFPREIQQGLTFEKEVTSPRLIFNYSCPDDILIERLLERGKHSGRVDDNEESIKKRLELFHGVTEPVIAHYGDLVRTIDSSLSVDEVFAATCKVLDQIDGKSEVEVKEEKITPVEEITTGGRGNMKHLFDNMSEKCVVFSVGLEGCGKTKVCDKIVESFGFSLLSLEGILKEVVQMETERAQNVAAIMESGAAIPPGVIIELLGEAILNLENVSKILIDGFPRTVEEAELFEEEIVAANHLVYFTCPTEKLSGELNSDTETIQKKLESFEADILPILQKYKEKNAGIEISLGGNEDESWENIEKVFSGLTNVSNNETTEKSVPNIILVLGGPGCGKGTQCAKIVEKYGFCHLSTGDLLREEVKQDSERAHMLNDIMKKGELVPTEVILQLVSQAIEEKKDSKGFLIDGFPRDVEQGLKFEETVGKCKCILYFKCSEECMVERLLERAKTSGRADDNIDTIKLRLKTFTDQTIPVLEKFKDLVKEVDAERSVEEIFTDICEYLDSI